MKKLYCTAVMMIAVMTVLATCASAQQTDSGTRAGTVDGVVQATPATTAADLVRALDGRVTVNGNTVTLTGNIGVQKDLVVPEGITLDLAEGSGLWLHDGVTLTVNGTVNAPSNRIGWDTSAGARWITINGNGTINLKSKGQLLIISEGRKLTLDGVTLVGLADNNESLVGVYEGGEFILKSGAITGNTRVTNGGGGGVNVWQATFIMEGGEISGNTAISSTRVEGGGVGVWNATFIMIGGAISGNTAISSTEDSMGGGVCVNESVFIMEGGTISGNTATGSNRGNGGGIRVTNGSTFTMKGGTISGNTVTRGTGWCIGGGVHVKGDSVFIMEGGTIYGNANSLPTGTDASLANSAPEGSSLFVEGTAKWGTGGAYTKGGVPQTAGSGITSTDDTLIAIPAR